MVDWGILKLKIQTVSAVIKLTKTFLFVIALFNIWGFIYKRVEFTISISLIVIVILWVWTLDSQISRIESLLKKKGIMEEEMKNQQINKRGMTQVGILFIWAIIILVVLLGLYLMFLK